MARVLSKTTPLVYLESVNTPDYDPNDWWINPNVSAVTGVPLRYWISGDPVQLMSPAQRQAVDDALEQEAILRRRNEAITHLTYRDSLGVQVRAIIQLCNQRDNYLINRINQLQAALLAMKATTGAVQTVRDAIPATFLPTATRNLSEAMDDYRDDINSGARDNG